MTRSNLLPALIIPTLSLLMSACGSQTTPQATEGAKISTQRLLCVDPTDPACQPPPPPPPPVNLSRSFEVYLNSMYAAQTTDSDRPSGGLGNSRDEVFVQVQASTPTGQYPVRLPRRPDNEDYYGFSTYTNATTDVSTWLDRDNAYMGKPMIYSGMLADGQSVQFLVTLLEQDNKSLGTIREATQATLSGLSGLSLGSSTPTGAIVKAALATASGLAALIPNNNAGDVIGGFTVRITNKAGVLERTWIPLDKVTVEKGTASTAMDNNDPYVVSSSTATLDLHSFTMSATSHGSYQATAAVETVDVAKASEDRPLMYLGDQNDACGSDNLVLNNTRIGKNETKGINVSLSGGDHWWNSGSYFHWDCDGSSEQTGPDGETNYVIASHHGGYGDRDIHWYTFKKVNQ